MSSGDPTWVDILSAIAAAVAAVLSVVALGVTVYVARIASRQSQEVADEQARRETSRFIVSRKQDVLAHGKAALVASRRVNSLLSPRLSELLSEQASVASERTELRQEVRHLLAELNTEVALLRALDTTVGGDHQLPTARLADLLNEAAWMATDATHLAFLAFERRDSRDEVDLTDHQSIVDALMNGSLVNLNSRLLAECAELEPGSVPSYSQPGSPWPQIYKRRESLLMQSSALRGSWNPESLADAASRSLALSIDRFEDALVVLLRKFGSRP